MTNPLLTRRTHRPKPGLDFLDGLSLAPSRAHEFCGPARRTLALIAARATQGPVFWISPDWQQDRLHAEGMLGFINPGRLTLITPHRPEDILWVMEESLRAGPVPLVICELPGLPHLTAVRRLHLAAETAGRERGQATLGLLLIAGNGGAPGVESRWYMEPAHSSDSQRWHLERRRARMAPVADWTLTKRGDALILDPAKTAQKFAPSLASS